MVQLHCTGIDRRRLPAAVETALYRVAQEALTNVLKHARAEPRERDRGAPGRRGAGHRRGRRPGLRRPRRVLGSPDARRRLGLLGMEERVTQLGGALEIESSPGSGTSLFIRIPLPGEGRSDHG